MYVLITDKLGKADDRIDSFKLTKKGFLKEYIEWVRLHIKLVGHESL